MHLLAIFVVALLLPICCYTHKPKPKKPPPPSYECTDGYSLLGHNCYKAFTYPDKYLTWHEAEKKCKSEGANLVSIHNEIERDFVSVLALEEAKKNGDSCEKHGKAFFWIGLKVKYEGENLKKVYWSDSSEVDFLNAKQYGAKKKPLKLLPPDDKEGGGYGYGKEVVLYVFLGQLPRGGYDKCKRDELLDEWGGDMLWWNSEPDKPSKVGGPHGAVCEKKAQKKKGYGYGEEEGGYGGGGGEGEHAASGESGEGSEEGESGSVYGVVLSGEKVYDGSSNFYYAGCNTYLVVLYKGAYGYGGGKLSEEQKIKVCKELKGEYVKIKKLEDEGVKKYLKKALEKEKELYPGSNDEIVCKYGTVLSGCTCGDGGDGGEYGYGYGKKC